MANNSALMRLPVPLGLSTIPPPLPLHPQSRATTRKEGGMCVRGSNRPGSKRLYCIQQSTVDNPHLCIYFCSSCNSPGPMSSWKSMTILDSMFLVFDHDPWSPCDPDILFMILYICTYIHSTFKLLNYFFHFFREFVWPFSLGYSDDLKWRKCCIK